MSLSKIIILIGFQASTKSSLATEIHNTNPNSVILSRDIEGGTIENFLKKVELYIKDNKLIIIDNTNLTKSTRKLFIDLAKEYNIDIDAYYFKTTIEECQIRHLKRMYDKFGQIYQTGKGPKDPHCFGSVVLFKARKDLEIPSKDEGFNNLIIRTPPPITWDTNIFKNKAIFLDIDGTIRETNSLPYKYPTNLDEVKLIHSAELMRSKLESYRAQGYKLIGVSNQSGISKDILTVEKADEIFEHTRSLLGYSIEDFPIMYCPHRAAPITCFCRKPQSGMAMESIMTFKLNPEECIMVGDMKTDETMAKRLNIKYVHVSDFWST